MNFPLAALVANVYVLAAFEYGVYVSVTVSLPTPVFTVLEYVVTPLTHSVEYAVICVLVNTFCAIVTAFVFVAVVAYNLYCPLVDPESVIPVHSTVLFVPAFAFEALHVPVAVTMSPVSTIPTFIVHVTVSVPSYVLSVHVPIEAVNVFFVILTAFSFVAVVEDNVYLAASVPESVIFEHVTVLLSPTVADGIVHVPVAVTVSPLSFVARFIVQLTVVVLSYSLFICSNSIKVYYYDTIFNSQEKGTCRFMPRIIIFLLSIEVDGRGVMGRRDL